MWLVTALCDWSWTGTCKIWFSPGPRQNKFVLEPRRGLISAAESWEGRMPWPCRGRACLARRLPCSAPSAPLWGQSKGSEARYIYFATFWHFPVFNGQRLLKLSMFPSVCRFSSTLGWNSCVFHINGKMTELNLMQFVGELLTYIWNMTFPDALDFLP